MSLIDIGCGNGVFIEDALNHTKNIDLCGMDFSNEVINLNRGYFEKYNCRGRNIMFVPGTVEKMSLTLARNSFDYVVCMEVMEHIDDSMKLLADLVFLCKPTGRVFITVPNKEAIVSEEHVHYFSNADMLEMIGRVGTNVEHERISKPNGKSVRNLAYCFRPK